MAGEIWKSTGDKTAVCYIGNYVMDGGIGEEQVAKDLDKMGLWKHVVGIQMSTNKKVLEISLLIKNKLVNNA